MLRLYIANKNYSSWSLRPWVLLRQLDISFEETLVPFGAKSKTEFAQFSPTSKVPCLVDGDLTVWDSLAIIEYLAEVHRAIWPGERAARAWARCASAELHSGFFEIRNACAMSCGVRVRLNSVTPTLQAEWARVDALWNEGLARFGGPFLAGDAFTAVDAFYAPFVFRIQSYAPRLSPTAQAYAQRLLGLPAMQQWYAAALKEVWRDEAHDVEIQAAGEITQDFREQP